MDRERREQEGLVVGARLTGGRTEAHQNFLRLSFLPSCPPKLLRPQSEVSSLKCVCVWLKLINEHRRVECLVL